MLISRQPRRRDRHLWWKAGLLVAGAILLVIGVESQRRWMMAIGMAALVMAFVLRFLRQKEGDEKAMKGR